MKRLIVVGTLLVGMAAAPAAGHAGRSVEGRPVDITDEMMQRYQLHPLIYKFGRGAGNLLTGWLEIPLNIQKRYDVNDTATSLVAGAGIGVIKGVVRTGVGLYELVTFWLPYPPNYAPILPTLEYFKRPPNEPRRELLLE